MAEGGGGGSWGMRQSELPKVSAHNIQKFVLSFGYSHRGKRAREQASSKTIDKLFRCFIEVLL